MIKKCNKCLYTKIYRFYGFLLLALSLALTIYMVIKYYKYD